MKQILQLTFITMGMLATIACNGQNGNTTASDNKGAAATEAVVEAEKINWLTFEEAVKMNETAPRQIFIDFYTDWCGWCKVMDRNTFTDPNVVKIMNNYFYPVKFNAEGKEPVVFNGKTYNFVPQGNRGYHELAANIMMGEMSYPTFIFMNEKYEIVTPVKGYVAPAEFEPIASYIGLRKYDNNVDYEAYKAAYQLGSTPAPAKSQP